MYKTKIRSLFLILLSVLLGCKNNDSNKSESTTLNSHLTKEEALQWLEKQNNRPIQPFTVPDMVDIPDNPTGERIRQGIALVSNTSELMGPNASDPDKRFSFNNLNCTHCHRAGPSGLPGTERYSMPWVNVLNDYPKFDPKSMRMISLEERIIGMFGKGQVPLTPDTEEIQFILDYIRWLNHQAKPGHAMEGTGIQHLTLDRAADPETGKILYEQKCLQCHGKKGLGFQHPDFLKGKGYVYPPVAGDDTYDDGGHVYMIPTLASMIYVNMPYGLASPDRPALSVEEAYDIAAYINHGLERRHNPNRHLMYPDPFFRPDAFVIPDFFDQDTSEYLEAKFGPYQQPYGYHGE